MPKNITVTADGKMLSGAQLSSVATNLKTDFNVKSLVCDEKEYWRKEYYVIGNPDGKNDYSDGWTTSHSVGISGNLRTIRLSENELYVKAENEANTRASITSAVALPTSRYDRMHITMALKTYDQYGTRGSSSIKLGNFWTARGNDGDGKKYQTLKEYEVDISALDSDVVLSLGSRSGVDTASFCYGEARIAKLWFE